MLTFTRQNLHKALLLNLDRWAICSCFLSLCCWVKKKNWFLTAAGGLRNMFAFLEREVQEQVVIYVKCWNMSARTKTWAVSSPESLLVTFSCLCLTFQHKIHELLQGEPMFFFSNIATKERRCVTCCSYLLILVGNHISSVQIMQMTVDLWHHPLPFPCNVFCT